jgi:hypothetical protein
MISILNACAVIAFLRDEPGGGIGRKLSCQ